MISIPIDFTSTPWQVIEYIDTIITEEIKAIAFIIWLSKVTAWPFLADRNMLRNSTRNFSSTSKTVKNNPTHSIE